MQLWNIYFTRPYHITDKAKNQEKIWDVRYLDEVIVYTFQSAKSLRIGFRERDFRPGFALKRVGAFAKSEERI